MTLISKSRAINRYGCVKDIRQRQQALENQLQTTNYVRQMALSCCRLQSGKSVALVVCFGLEEVLVPGLIWFVIQVNVH